MTRVEISPMSMTSYGSFSRCSFSPFVAYPLFVSLHFFSLSLSVFFSFYLYVFFLSFSFSLFSIYLSLSLISRPSFPLAFQFLCVAFLPSSSLLCLQLFLFLSPLDSLSLLSQAQAGLLSPSLVSRVFLFIIDKKREIPLCVSQWGE